MLKEYIPKIGDIVSYEGTSTVRGTTRTADGNILVDLEPDDFLERIQININKCYKLDREELNR